MVAAQLSRPLGEQRGSRRRAASGLGTLLLLLVLLLVGPAWARAERSLYDVLEVDADASAEDIKQSYRRLAKKLHPDKGGDEAAFIELQQAHEVLSDEEKRREYDLSRTQGGGYGGRGSGRGGADPFGFPRSTNVRYYRTFMGPDGRMYRQYFEGPPSGGAQWGSGRGGFGSAGGDNSFASWMASPVASDALQLLLVVGVLLATVFLLQRSHEDATDRPPRRAGNRHAGESAEHSAHNSPRRAAGERGERERGGDGNGDGEEDGDEDGSPHDIDHAARARRPARTSTPLSSMPDSRSRPGRPTSSSTYVPRGFEASADPVILLQREAHSLCRAAYPLSSSLLEAPSHASSGQPRNLVVAALLPLEWWSQGLPNERPHWRRVLWDALNGLAAAFRRDGVSVAFVGIEADEPESHPTPFRVAAGLAASHGPEVRRLVHALARTMAPVLAAAPQRVTSTTGVWLLSLRRYRATGCQVAWRWVAQVDDERPPADGEGAGGSTERTGDEDGAIEGARSTEDAVTAGSPPTMGERMERWVQSVVEGTVPHATLEFAEDD